MCARFASLLRVALDLLMPIRVWSSRALRSGGVVFRNAVYQSGELLKGRYLAAWWTRAELLGLDILVDLAYCV